jgi:hypothetical protein
MSAQFVNSYLIELSPGLLLLVTAGTMLVGGMVALLTPETDGTSDTAEDGDAVPGDSAGLLDRA